MKFLCIVLLSFIPSLAFAVDFGGLWSLQEGNIAYFDGQNAACEKGGFRFEQTNTSLDLRYGFVECHSGRKNWNRVKFEIKNGHDLLLEGKVIGSISNNSLSFTYDNWHSDRIEEFLFTVQQDGSVLFQNQTRKRTGTSSPLVTVNMRLTLVGQPSL